MWQQSYKKHGVFEFQNTNHSAEQQRFNCKLSIFKLSNGRVQNIVCVEIVQRRPQPDANDCVLHGVVALSSSKFGHSSGQSATRFVWIRVGSRFLHRHSSAMQPVVCVCARARACACEDDVILHRKLPYKSVIAWREFYRKLKRHLNDIIVDIVTSIHQM